jgi:hypothetical protein
LYQQISRCFGASSVFLPVKSTPDAILDHSLVMLARILADDHLIQASMNIGGGCQQIHGG